jgi:hypothetical protein
MLRKLQDERSPCEHEMLAEVQGSVSPDQLRDMNPTGLKTSISSEKPPKKRVCAWLSRGTSRGMQRVSLKIQACG